MNRWPGLLAVLLTLGPGASGAPTPPDRAGVTVHDPRGLLPAGQARVLTEKLRRLAEAGGPEVMVVVGRSDAPPAKNLPRDATGWLARWLQQDPGPEPEVDETLISEEPPEDEPAPQAKPAGPRRLVLRLDLAEPRVEAAVSPAASGLLTPSVIARLTDVIFHPAFEAASLEAVVEAIAATAGELASLAGVAATEPEPPAPPPVAPPPRPDFGAGWFVGLPTALGGLLFLIRLGPGPAAWLTPWLALLYAGLFFLLRFRPEALPYLGVAAIAPVALVLCAPPLVSRRPRTGGFGVTGWGAWGLDRPGGSR